MERGRSGSVGAPGVHGSVVITVRSRVRMTHAGGVGGQGCGDHGASGYNVRRNRNFSSPQ